MPVVTSARSSVRLGLRASLAQLVASASGVDAGRPAVSHARSDSGELERRLLEGERLVVVDVREASEWFAGHIPGSVNIPAHDLPSRAGRRPLGAPLAVHCGHVYRAALGASLLERAGQLQLTVVEDGYEGWAASRRASGLLIGEERR